MLSLDDVLVEALIIGLPFGIVYVLKANGNGAMNSGGDMSSKNGSIGNQNAYEKSLNWFMRVKPIYWFSLRSENGSSDRYDYGRSGDR